MNVCYECGVTANVLNCLKRYGAPPKQVSFSVSTYHKGMCGYCGQEKEITETRDFFYPDFGLIKLVAKFLDVQEDFFVCENHSKTGGYESCCGCSEGRECTEASN